MLGRASQHLPFSSPDWAGKLPNICPEAFQARPFIILGCSRRLRLAIQEIPQVDDKLRCAVSAAGTILRYRHNSRAQFRAQLLAHAWRPAQFPKGPKCSGTIPCTIPAQLPAHPSTSGTISGTFFIPRLAPAQFRHNSHTPGTIPCINQGSSGGLPRASFNNQAKRTRFTLGQKMRMVREMVVTYGIQESN